MSTTLLRPAEVVALRAYWLARLHAAEDSGSPSVDPYRWQDLLLLAAARLRGCLRVQGPGRARLFGRPGRSGEPNEIDVALEDAFGGMLLVEAKAYLDYRLPRDEVFVFAARVRDHERADHYRRHSFFALLASAGRVDATVARWSFFEGIDVADPDRMAIALLGRLPMLFPALCEGMAYPEGHEALVDLLQIGQEELQNGPVVLRRPDRLPRLCGAALKDVNQIQLAMTEAFWDALCTRFEGDVAQQDSAARDHIEGELRCAGVALR